MSQIDEAIEALIAKSSKYKLLWLDIDEVKEHPDNPRKISDEDFANLIQSIADFPEMMILRHGIINEHNQLIAGNQRHKGCKALGWTKFPVMYAHDFTDEQLKEFMIKDNLPFGEWDNKLLKADWDVAKLDEWGMDVTALIQNSIIPGKVVFARELDQEKNYVVLVFEKDIDFLNIQTILGLQSEYSTRQNGNPWAKGLGRVADGMIAIRTLQKADKI